MCTLLALQARVMNHCLSLLSPTYSVRPRNPQGDCLWAINSRKKGPNSSFFGQDTSGNSLYLGSSIGGHFTPGTLLQCHMDGCETPFVCLLFTDILQTSLSHTKRSFSIFFSKKKSKQRHLCVSDCFQVTLRNFSLLSEDGAGEADWKASFGFFSCWFLCLQLCSTQDGEGVNWKDYFFQRWREEEVWEESYFTCL